MNELNVIRKKSSNVFLVFGIALLVVFISVGYAVLNTSLNINGTITSKANSWDVYLEVGSEYALNSASVVKTATVDEISKTTLSFSYKFEKPDDRVTLSFDIVNNGTIDAMIDSFEMTPELTDLQKKYFHILSRFTDFEHGQKIERGTIIKANSRKEIVVFIDYLDDDSLKNLNNEDLISDSQTISFTYEINVIQADNIFDESSLLCTFKDGSTGEGTMKLDKSNNEHRIYINGDYYYEYLGEGKGWHPYVLDKDSTEPLTSKLCQTIDGEYITDMSSMFALSKPSLIDFSSYDTSNVESMEYMFQGNETPILDFTYLDTSNVTNMHGFLNHVAATSVNISNLDLSQVNDLEFFLAYSTNLESIDFSGLNFSNVTNMAHFLSGCTNLKSINMSGVDLSNVENASYMFSELNVTNLDLSNLNMSSAYDMSYMFLNCKGTSLNLTNFNTSGATIMTGMFRGVSYPTLDLSSFDTSNVYSMMGMFYESTSKTINLTSFDTRKVVDTSYMFCKSKATVLDLSCFDLMNLKTSDYMLNSVSAKTGYARSEEDMTKLNGTRGKSTSLVFSLKG